MLSAPIFHELDLELIGLIGNFLLVEQLLLLVPNSLFHSCFNEIFGGNRGDMFTFSKMTSPVFSLTTFGIQ